MPYSGGDGRGITLSEVCTDNAGKQASASSPAFNYDANPPTITGWTASRQPDFNGWYNHAVTFMFTGSDPVSGIDSCSKVTYTGPTSSNAMVVGGCEDNAGNIATLDVPIHYDATPPSVHASATTGDQIVRLNWQTSADLSSLTISRSPGVHGSSDSVVDRGGDGIFNDTRVTNGVRYTYTIRVRDQAGNVTVRRLKATPGVRLILPVNGARMTSPPLLIWTAVRHATYYNVQVYRAGRKVLSTWPGRATLALGQSWMFGGHRIHLRPGRYRWYVWPGYGSRRSARYGNLIGAGTFVVTRAS
jgi:hypothetical protein